MRVKRLVERGRYGDGNGLYLQVTSTGAKSWLFRYERLGKERWLGLGALHTVSLQEARERARRARQQILDGTDPIQAKQSQKAAEIIAAAKTVTFEVASNQYFAAHGSKWRNAKHRAQFLSTLKAYVFPAIGALPVSSIDLALVLRVLEPIWAEKPETASRIRGRVEGVLDWATVRGYRTGDNPARWKGHLQHVLPARDRLIQVRHHTALPYQQMPLFMKDLVAREGVAAAALRFTILTAARTGEVIGARWAEINLNDRVWTVPADRMKGGREHRVPLSNAAIEILKALPRETENNYVFIGPRGGGLSNMAMNALLRRMASYQTTVHGLRSSFRDWAAECTAFPNHVVEMALAHVISNAVEAAYRRGDLFDKRKKLMASWAIYTHAKPLQGAEIIPLRQDV
jgi:integrase